MSRMNDAEIKELKKSINLRTVDTCLTCDNAYVSDDAYEPIFIRCNKFPQLDFNLDFGTASVCDEYT